MVDNFMITFPDTIKIYVYTKIYGKISSKFVTPCLPEKNITKNENMNLFSQFQCCLRENK